MKAIKSHSYNSLLIVSIVLLVSSCGPSKKIDTPKKNQNLTMNSVEKLIGPKSFRLIQESDQITLYWVSQFAPRKNDLSKKPLFAGFEILETVKVDKMTTKRAVADLILAESTYNIDHTAKMCAFTPTIGLEFLSPKGSIKVLYSARCNEMKFINEDNEIVEDADPGRDRIIRMIKGLFPGKEVQYLD